MSFFNVFPYRLLVASFKARTLAALALTLLIIQGCASSPSLWRSHPGISPTLEAGAEVLGRLIVEEYRKALDESRSPGGGPSRRPLPIGVGSFVEKGKGRRLWLSWELEKALFRSLEASDAFSLFPRKDFLLWEERFAGNLAAGESAYGEEAAVKAGQYLGLEAVIVGNYELRRDEVVIWAELVRAERPRVRIRRERWTFLEPPTPEAERRRLARVKVDIKRESLSPLWLHTAVPSSTSIPPPRPPGVWLSPPVQVWYEIIRSDGERERGLGGGAIGPDDTIFIRFSALAPAYLYIFSLDQEGELEEVFPGGDGGRAGLVEARRHHARTIHIAEPEKIVNLYCLASPEPFDFGEDVLKGLAPLFGRLEREGRLLGGEGLALPASFYQHAFWFLRQR